MAELKTYTVTCPDEDCAEEFTIERAPETLGDDGELIQCPACLEEWEWSYEDGIITLLPDFDLEDDEEDEEDFFEDEEDEEEDY